MPLRRSGDWLKLSWQIGVTLPLVAAVFWLMTGWINDYVLSQTESRVTSLPAQGPHQVQLSLNVTIVSISAEIDHSEEFTEVSIRTIGSALEEMEFKFPVTELAAIENAIAQELNLAPQDIHPLIRYRIDE